MNETVAYYPNGDLFFPEREKKRLEALKPSPEGKQPGGGECHELNLSALEKESALVKSSPPTE